jgi:uncharacterized protein (TIGR02145 family)
MKIKKIRIAFFSIALLSFFVVQYGCKKDDKPDPEPTPTDELKISEVVVEIDTIQMGTPVIEGDNYTFTDNGNLPEFNEGDIIVSNSGYGYIRKITSISTQGDNIVLTTSQATLEEVIENCNIKDEIQLTLSKAIYKGKEYPAKVVFLAKGAKISEKGGINLSGFQIFSGNYGGADVNAQIDQGSINFEPVLTREIEIRMFKLKHLRLSSGGDLDFTCDASIVVDAPVSIEKEKLIAQIYFGPFPFGPVPVFVVLSFNAGINANLDITGSIGSGFDTEAYLEYGADYTNSQWSTIWEKSFKNNSHGVTWDLSGETDSKVYVSPEVGFLVAGVAGPYMEAVPYLGFDGNINSSYQTWNWDLSAGAEGNIGFIVQIFGVTIANYSTTLANWEAIIAHDNGDLGTNTPPTAIFTVSPASGTTSTNFEFDASDSYDNEDPTSDLQVRWDFDGNGSWDTNWDTDKTKNHQFIDEDIYTVKMEVKDTKGLIDEISQDITVSNGVVAGELCPGIPSVIHEGQVYNTVLIGTQCWLKENLNIGTMINGSEDMENNGTIEKYCYDDNPSNCELYGGLYQWNELMQYVTNEGAQGICPDGWHVPIKVEWDILAEILGGSDFAGGKMKSTIGWYNNGNGTNISGFTALPSGKRTTGSLIFRDIDKFADYWSSTSRIIYSETLRWRLFYAFEDLTYFSHDWDYGYSVRCVKD